MDEEKKEAAGEKQPEVTKEPGEAKAPPEKSEAEAKEAKPAAPEKVVKPKECSVCSKNMDKKWYYRDGAFYCGKGCWKKTKKKAEADQETEKK